MVGGEHAIQGGGGELPRHGREFARSFISINFLSLPSSPGRPGRDLILPDNYT